MRSVEKATVVGLAALVGLATFAGVAQALTTLTVDKCLASQVRIVGKGAAASMGCYAKGAAKGVPTDPDCLAKAAAKVGPALAKLEAKKVCLVEGTGTQRTNDVAAYAANVDATGGHAAGKCDTAKTKLVGRYVAAIANCHAKAAIKTGTVDGTCVSKAVGKLSAGIARAETRVDCSHDGQTATLAAAANAFVDAQVCALDPSNPGCVPVPTPTPTSTPIPTTTATPVCNNGINEPGEPCDESAPSAGWGACSPGLTCTSCTCGCPTTMVFSVDADAAETVLDAGVSGLGHGTPLSSGGDVTVQLDCPGPSHPCGTCAITGPIANAQAGAGDLDNRRCSTDSSKKCTADALCAARTCLGGANHGASCATDSGCPSGTCPAAGACGFYSGAPFPIGVGGVGICVLNEFNGAVTGTANVAAGELAMATTLAARVYFLGLTPFAVDGPCPRCSDAGGINDGVNGGTCDAGPRVGLACDANGAVPERPDFGRTSLDCPPAPSTFISTLTVDLDNATDPVTKTLTVDSPGCSSAPGSRCLCDTCNNANAEVCTSNADCPPSGGHPGVCGGRRCLGGSNVGSPCSASSQCPGVTSGCGRRGEPTQPFACSDFDEPPPGQQCVDGEGDGEGACVFGPTDQRCSLASGHAQRGCTTDTDCDGTMGSCESHPRGCFLTGGGTFQPANFYDDGTDTLMAVGMEDAPLAGVSHPTLASVFCVGPTTSAVINNVVGLPGPGRVTVKGMTTMRP